MKTRFWRCALAVAVGFLFPGWMTAQTGQTVKQESLTGMKLVWIPGGDFDMGHADRYPDEVPVHRVHVDGFWIGQTEVTQTHWDKVMMKLPSLHQGWDFPVENISFEDVEAFIAELNRRTGQKFRLPNEAEWEYACRAGAAGDWYGELDGIAWYDKNADKKTHLVGRKTPNAFNLYDMLGNVWEWCADFYGEKYYANSPASNPQGPDSGAYRVVRGGSWNSPIQRVRAPSRFGYPPGSKFAFVGFRLVLAE
ncbi:MAG: SUMF1/EgtB/PvdO family nonheme iron enzyme [Acidobacteriota bacterium]|nr:SUMF1/EgtB/PvdO family nonheme iron enzyme [Acidobacteriota bacterium]